jgi:hypothetical protein
VISFLQGFNSGCNLVYPKTLKLGIACPILKKGKPAHDPNSYRKITITNLIGKVIEKNPSN